MVVENIFTYNLKLVDKRISCDFITQIYFSKKVKTNEEKVLYVKSHIR